MVTHDMEPDGGKCILCRKDRIPGLNTSFCSLKCEEEYDLDCISRSDEEFPVYYDAQGREHAEF